MEKCRKWSLAAVWPRWELRKKINFTVPLCAAKKGSLENLAKSLWLNQRAGLHNKLLQFFYVGESMSNWYHMPCCKLFYLLLLQASHSSFQLSPVIKLFTLGRFGLPGKWPKCAPHLLEVNSTTAWWEMTAGFNWPPCGLLLNLPSRIRCNLCVCKSKVKL